MAHECAPHGLPSLGFGHGCYADLKRRWTEGQALTDAERAFIGAVPTPRPRDGWRSPSLLAIGMFEDDAELSAEDSEILGKLMAVGSQERLRFLG